VVNIDVVNRHRGQLRPWSIETWSILTWSNERWLIATWSIGTVVNINVVKRDAS